MVATIRMSEAPADKSIKQKEQLAAYSESKESEPPKEWKVVHTMNEKHAAMYEYLIQDRAMQRAKNSEEDVAARNMFIELGRKAFEEQMVKQSALDKVNSTF